MYKNFLKFFIPITIAILGCATTQTGTPEAETRGAIVQTTATTSQPIPLKCFMVTVEAVHIRAQPNAESQIVGFRSHGEILTVTGRTPYWLHDGQGWSKADFFAEVTCP